MQKLKTLAATLLVGTSAATGIALAQDNASVSRPSATFKFGPTGVKTAIGELMAAGAYGDLTKGAHGTFIRMPAGFVSAPHTHSDDYFGIVIEGVAVNTQDGKNDIQLPVGSYWLQKGKERHVTKCVSKTDCLFFIYQPGKFDYVPSN
jgi:beta-alanine degradation protein BauB